MHFDNKNNFSFLKKRSSQNNAGVVAVNSEVIGLAPGFCFRIEHVCIMG
jgi:hypothetical protein